MARVSELALVGLRRTATVVGGLAESERRFATALVRGLAASVGPEASVAYAVLARHASWRADQWFAVLPDQPELGPEQLMVCPPDAPAVLMGSDLMTVAAARTEVLPWLAARTAVVAALADPVGEGPTRRAAVRIAADLAADLS